jgi:hypothetical protein
MSILGPCCSSWEIGGVGELTAVMGFILLLWDTNPEMEPESHKVVGLEQQVKYVLLWYLGLLRHSDAALRIWKPSFQFRLIEIQL